MSTIFTILIFVLYLNSIIFDRNQLIKAEEKLICQLNFKIL